VYASVFLFNLVVTIAIGDHALAGASAAVIAGTLGVVARRLRAPRRGTIVVCAATGAEAAACRDGIRDAGVQGLEVLRTGVGPERAARALRARLAVAPRPTLVVSSGFAGALTPGLEVGGFVTAGEVLEPTAGGVARVPLGPGALRLAPASARAAVVSSAGVLQPPVPVAAPAAADMESAALARVAAAAGVPFAVYRLVSDGPAAPLPPVARSAAAILAAPWSGRAPHAARAAWDVLRAPGEAAALVRDGLAWTRRLRAGWRDRAREIAAPLPAAASGRELAGG
jgi:hypothetical protein